MIRFLAVASLLALGASFGLVACGEEEPSFCVPGEPTYCQCAGSRDPGEHVCNEDGATFGPCINTDTGEECQEVPTSSSTGEPTNCEPDSTKDCTCEDGVTMGEQTCDADGDAYGPCLVDGEPCSAPPTLDVYAPCTEDAECLTGVCEGFCTRECETFMECEETADCVDFGSGTTHCAPYCFSQEDCAPFGSTAVCSGVEDPTWIFAACGPFDPPQGMPYGTVCDEVAGEILAGDPQNPEVVQAQCHLGLAGVQNICVFSECSKACYEDIDCPQADCTSDGMVPGCCASEPDCT